MRTIAPAKRMTTILALLRHRATRVRAHRDRHQRCLRPSKASPTQWTNPKFPALRQPAKLAQGFWNVVVRTWRKRYISPIRGSMMNYYFVRGETFARARGKRNKIGKRQ